MPTNAPQPPERLVRFYGNADYALDTIASRHVTFVHRTKLNDPFDPYLVLETDFEASYVKLG